MTTKEKANEEWAKVQNENTPINFQISSSLMKPKIESQGEQKYALH